MLKALLTPPKNCEWYPISQYFQEVPDKSVHSTGGPWTFCGLLPLFDPPRHDSAETIRRALHLGVCVKMITGMDIILYLRTKSFVLASIISNFSISIFCSIDEFRCFFMCFNDKFSCLLFL